MNIEIHTPGGKVKEWVTSYVRDKLAELNRGNNKIAKAEVYFWQQMKTKNGDKACEIDLNICGDSLFVYRKAFSYEKAAREVLTELHQKIDNKFSKQNVTAGILRSAEML